MKLKKILIFAFAVFAVMLTSCKKEDPYDPDLPDNSPLIESGTLGNSFTWSLTQKGTLTISGEDAMADFKNAGQSPWYKYNSSIRKVVINDGVTRIADWAFFGCKNAVRGNIPDGVTHIGENAFWGWERLPSITMPGSVTSIGEHAFWDCRNLTSITIPNGMTNIGYRAFGSCDKLLNVTIMATIPPALDSGNFVIDADTLHIPRGCMEAYKSSKWNDVFSVIVEQ